MLSRSRPLFVAALVLLLAGSTLHGVQAQPSRTLVIQDGTVYLDGRPVPDDALPPTLDVRDLNVRYSFSGIAQPVVELNGALYAIGDSLTPVDPDAVSARQSAVLLQRPASTGAEEVEADAAASGHSANVARAPVELQPFQAQYLEAIQQRHERLYERLMRERRMEAETYELARAIQQLAPGEDRQRYLDSLRTTLDEIFELKQENRRREIQQLENQLNELQRRLEERERVREQMIEQRIHQLVGDAARP